MNYCPTYLTYSFIKSHNTPYDVDNNIDYYFKDGRIKMLKIKDLDQGHGQWKMEPD